LRRLGGVQQWNDDGHRGRSHYRIPGTHCALTDAKETSAARLIAPQKPLVVGFPYRRFKDELRVAAGRHFKIRPHAHVRHQFADRVIAADGTAASKPPAW